MAFLETGAFVGLVAPGETVVMAGGVVAGQGTIQLLPLIGIVWVCAVLGDTTSFYIGRRLGRRFLERHGPRFKITEERLQQVESYFERHGGKTILIGRFIGLVRALAPFIAGSSGLLYGRFIPYSIVGTGLWSSLFCSLGYLFWRSFDQVAHLVGQAIFGLGVTVAVIVAIVVAYRRRREIASWLVRARARTRWSARCWRSVGRFTAGWCGPSTQVAMPYLRFLFDRITPGTLGLELTTLMAVAGVGLFVFVVYLTELDRNLGPTPFDTELLDLADRLRIDMLIDVAKIVTALGAFPTAAALVVAHGAAARAAQALRGGARARPRPRAHLRGRERERRTRSGASGPAARSSAPRGTRTRAATRRTPRRGSPSRWRSRAGCAWSASGHARVVAIGIAAAVGLSRVYLRAHWWSDVAGGWGLGAGYSRCWRQSRSSSSTSATMGASARPSPRFRGRARDAMSNLDLSSTEIVVALAGALVLALLRRCSSRCRPSRCYGRVWEKLAASVLTLYVLATLLGIGAAIGLAIVWTYDTYA